MTGEKVVGQTASHSASESNRFWLPCSQLFSSWLHKNDLNSGHRRKIYTEEKTKVVAAAWGTESNKFLAFANYFAKRMNWTRII